MSVNEKWEKMTWGPFFNLFKPYFDFISKEKLFSLVYYIMAVVNLLIPFGVLYFAISSGILRYGAKFVFAVIFVWLVICFASWVGFQLWWDRQKRLAAIGASGFTATMIVSEIIQTSGEWFGTWIAIVGAGGGLLASIFLGNEISYLPFIGDFGIAVVVVGPVLGFFWIIFSRFIAEQLRIFTTIADSTKDIAAKNR